MILLDTTCLVYAVGDDHERRASSRALIDAALRGTVTARTTSQIIMEFAHVRGRRRDRKDAASLARDFSDLLGPLETTTAPVVATALTLWQDNPRIGSFSVAIHTATINPGSPTARNAACQARRARSFVSASSTASGRRHPRSASFSNTSRIAR